MNVAVDLSFLLADDDFYESWESGDPGKRYRPRSVPPEWRSQDTGPWTFWTYPGARRPEQAWKIHVSSSLANAQPVLEVVATAGTEFRIPFKHLAGRTAFRHAHAKHADRIQSGKFCALYPQDTELCRAVLERLTTDLAGIEGPYVLTDRRFADSKCVSYRYGGFTSRSRITADGTTVPTMLAPDGSEIDDERRPEFHLPPGVEDPFRVPPSGAGRAEIAFHGYTFVEVLRHANAGGAYRFRSPAGETVFVKEARAHNGYASDGSDAKARLAGEYLTLRTLHAADPGICPRPAELFHHWEHSYLATEFVPGMPLYRWMTTHNPAVRAGEPAAAFAAYYERCLTLLDHLDDQLRRLHDLGFVFVDLSPNNVLVDDDHPRLVDFEAAQRIDDVHLVMGTPGYLPRDARTLAWHDPVVVDRRGLANLALLLLFPLNDVVEREPEVLPHLQADLAEVATVPPRLWRLATADRVPPTQPRLPTPATIRADTATELRRLADRTADTLAAMAQPDHPRRVYPTNPLGLRTNTRSVATGTAGVLHALHRANRPIDPAVVRRLRDDSLAAVDVTPPGLFFGTAGIACVLADLGEPEAADTLLDAATDHPLNTTSATLGGGAAGTALALLTAYCRHGDERRLTAAARLLDAIPAGDALETGLSTEYPTGLIGGRPGVALALYYLARITGDEAVLTRGMRLLRDELAHGVLTPVQALSFRFSADDRRIVPYLHVGSAGYVEVLSRYLAHNPDHDFDTPAPLSAADDSEPDAKLGAPEVQARCLQSCTSRFTALPGLFPGLAGLTMTLAEAGRRLARPDLTDAAVTSARGLFRHAIPREDGLAWLGDPGQRLSADLWSGSAGVLLAVRQLTDPTPDPLFTLDRFLDQSRAAVTDTDKE
ncbi:MAG TPA: class III lanthionine synthetase LanKC [Pseudonocardiaceae bacterium]